MKTKRTIVVPRYGKAQYSGVILEFGKPSVNIAAVCEGV
jgi:hypothetical protein